MPEQILVFDRRKIPKLPTAVFSRDTSILPEILSVAEFVERDAAEIDPTYKQIIPYSLLRYNGLIFRYRRSAWGGETRLHGQYSLGIGGHVNDSDQLPLLIETTPIVELTRDREIHEEFIVSGLGEPHLIGILNDESNEVGRVHYGVIYEYFLSAPNVAPREKRAHIHHEFVPIASLPQHYVEYENWSRILIERYLHVDPYNPTGGGEA